MRLILHRLRRRLRALLFREAVDCEMREELRIHIESETEYLMKTRGVSRGEASRLARIAFGGVDRFEEDIRDARGVRPLEEFIRDTKLAVRTLRRNPAFAGVAVLTLGIGLGAVTGIFSIINRVLLQPLPYTDADRLVEVRHRAPGLGLNETGLSLGTFFHYRTHSRMLEGLALYSESVLNLAGQESAERIHITNAGPELFDVLGVQPVLGRLYAERDWTGSNMDGRWKIPILLSYEFWQQRFGGDSAIIGRVLTINDTPREVFGVLPEGFPFPRKETQVWRMDMRDEAYADFAAFLDYAAVGRLREGVTTTMAAAELDRILPSIEGVFRDATAERIAEVGLKPLVLPLKEVVVGETGKALWILFGGMTFLLLVACANVANLFLVRSENRAREVAVRTALGAPRSALARLFLAESLVVSTLGALLGLALAGAGLRILVRFSPVELPRLEEVRLDAWAFGFTAAIMLLVAVTFGSLSLLRHTRSSTLAPAMKGGRGLAGADSRRRLVLDTIVAAQVALTLALLVGSALMVQSYFRLTEVDRGYNAHDVLTVEVGVPYRKAAQHQQLYQDVADRMQRIPGVMAVGAVSVLPLTGGGEEHLLRAADRNVQPDRVNAPVAFRFFVPGYFQTMQTEVVEGISFAPGDRTTLEHPVLVSETLARRLFSGERAIGRQVRRLDSEGEPVSLFDPATRKVVPLPPYTIAGVVRDVRDASLRARGGEAMYIPVIAPHVERSIMPTEMSFVLRTDPAAPGVAAAARRAVSDVDPTLSVARIRTMEAIVTASTATERFLAILLLIGGGAALLMGSVGIYGIAAYNVRRRTHEIGVRVALGAAPVEVMRMVLRESAVVVLCGAFAGLAIAVAGSRALHAILFEVSPTNPAVLAGVTALMVGIALAASLVPAQRAASTDPVQALRTD